LIFLESSFSNACTFKEPKYKTTKRIAIDVQVFFMEAQFKELTTSINIS
jgi:hypothetical protein